MAAARESLPPGRALQVTRFGRDQRDAIANSLEFAVQDPRALARSMRDGDILVRVRATEVVWTDTVMMTGQYQHQPELPYTPGMTYAGEIAALTPKAGAALELSVGDRVAIASPLTGPRSPAGPHQRFGGCATYAVAPWEAVRRFPDSWSFSEAACFVYGKRRIHCFGANVEDDKNLCPCVDTMTIC
jgi:NADPH:quinone reductase